MFKELQCVTQGDSEKAHDSSDDRPPTLLLSSLILDRSDVCALNFEPLVTASDDLTDLLSIRVWALGRMLREHRGTVLPMHLILGTRFQDS